MDILSPQLMWIGKRCYRINQTIAATNEKPRYQEQDFDDQEDDCNEYLIETKDNRIFKTTFHIPTAFFAQIIGAKGAVRKRIETETKTQIRIPKQGETGDIAITGSSKNTVASARRRVEIIVVAARNKQQFTHFLAVPMTPAIIEEFKRFREIVLADSSIKLEKSLFQTPEKLHITLCTLALMDNEDRSNAAQILTEVQDVIIKPIVEEFGAIELRVEGLEYMNDDPKAVDVIYGKIESEALQLLADDIVNYFVEKGLVQKQYERVKMHVTMLNSLFRDKSVDEQQKRETFDAGDLLKKYGSFYFGTMQLKEVHLSQRYSTGSNGFYEATAVIKT